MADEAAEPEADPEPGVLREFITLLDPIQRAMWPEVSRALKAAGRKATLALSAQRSTKDSLAAAFAQVKGTITAAKLTKLIDNAVLKGDAQTLRVLAQLAGEDLSERAAANTGPGAQVILLRPHPANLTPLEEADIRGQISQYETLNETP